MSARFEATALVVAGGVAAVYFHPYAALPILAPLAGLFLAATYPLAWPLPVVIAVIALLLAVAAAVVRRPLPAAAGVVALAQLQALQRRVSKAK